MRLDSHRVVARRDRLDSSLIAKRFGLNNEPGSYFQICVLGCMGFNQLEFEGQAFLCPVTVGWISLLTVPLRPTCFICVVVLVNSSFADKARRECPD